MVGVSPVGVGWVAFVCWFAGVVVVMMADLDIALVGLMLSGPPFWPPPSEPPAPDWENDDEDFHAEDCKNKQGSYDVYY